MNILNKLGLGSRRQTNMDPSPMAQGPDNDAPATGNQFAQFGAGCFWSVELAYQRVPGVNKTEVGYSQTVELAYQKDHTQSFLQDVCSGTTNHAEIVRVQYDPKECTYESLHDPTTLNRQGNDVGTQYRSGIYFYNPGQEKLARESMERHQQQLDRKVVTEILPARKFTEPRNITSNTCLKEGGSVLSNLLQKAAMTQSAVTGKSLALTQYQGIVFHLSI